MNIKLVLNTNIHKMSNKPNSFQELLESISKTLKNKLPLNYDIKYQDYEGDMIIIQDEDDFQSAFDYYKEEKLPSMKLNILPQQQPGSDING